MAQSPFAGNHAIFLLLGLTDDQFCLPDTRLVDLSTYLDVHLRSIGFKQIAFYRQEDGVRITGVSPEPQPPPSHPPAPRASARKSLVGGPLGQIEVLSPQTSSASPRTVQPEIKTLNKMKDTALSSFLSYFFKGDVHKAFIIEDFEDLMDFKEQARRTFWERLRRIQAQSTGKEKIIFLSNSRNTGS